MAHERPAVPPGSSPPRRLPGGSAGSAEQGRRGLRLLVDGRFINDRFPGVGRYTFNLVRALGALDTGDTVLVLVNPRLPNLRFDLTQLASLPGVRLVACEVPRYYPLELLELPRVVRGLQPDLLHVPFFLRPYGLPCPCVVTLHDLIPLHRRVAPPGALNRAVFAVGARLAAHLSAAVIVPTAAVAREVERRLRPGDGRVHVVPYAPDPWFGPQPAAAVAGVRERLGLVHPYVLHVGRHLPHKNLDGLFRAWALMSGAGGQAPRPYRLVLVGDDDEMGRTARLAARLGVSAAVRVLGEVAEEDLPAVYAGADACVVPSLAEGWGLPVVEAMACGTPVVCSNLGALPETAGGAALLADSGDPGELAAALGRVLADGELRRRLSTAGLARAAGLSWMAVARGTRAVYAAVARSGRSTSQCV